MEGGSPDASPAAAPGQGLDGLQVALRMVAAAEAAAAAATAAQELLSRTTTGGGSEENKPWWKFLPKPPVFDHATREQEIASWREWSRAFEQYMSSIDVKFAEDIKKVREKPDVEIDPVDFNEQEKQRNAFLYSLLSSLLRQRALLVVRQISGCNGLESYRALIQQNEPMTKNRSMGLLNVVMNWPSFSNSVPLMQRLLKLEHAYSEYEKLGKQLSDDLKAAILMRSVQGQLKTWLQLRVSETTAYAKVREMIL